MAAGVFEDNIVLFDGIRIKSPADAPNYNLNINGINNNISLSKLEGSGYVHVNVQASVSNCDLCIGRNNRIAANLFLNYFYSGGRFANNVRISIGDNNIFNGNVHISAGTHSGTATRVGNENLFADNIHISAAAEHLVYDINTKEKLNAEKGIILEDRIWVCKDALILNRAHVRSDCIVAARAVVNKAFSDNNLLIAGCPAKVARRDVMWHLNTTDEYLSNSSPLMLR